MTCFHFMVGQPGLFERFFVPWTGGQALTNNLDFMFTAWRLGTN